MTIKRHIPNAVTCMNLVCGVAGIVFAICGRLDCALWAMLCGAAFDFCDGFAARALNAGSEFGKQLDSLSDVITFGLLPGLMFSTFTALNCGSPCDIASGWNVWACVPLLLPVGAALRLAKFNVDEAQATGFLGLPTPACALLCGCLTWFIYGHPDSIIAEWARGDIFLPVLSVILCALMVSRIPMFSLKFTDDTPKRPLIIAGAVIIILAALLLCLGMHISLIAALLLAAYILFNCTKAIFTKNKS